MKKSLQFSKSIFAVALLLPLAPAVAAFAQTPTQVILQPDAQRESAVPDVSTLSVQLNGKATPLTSVARLIPGNAQVALFIDDGIGHIPGLELADLKTFATSMPAGTQVLIGYLEATGVQVLVPFTADHAAAAAKIRLPAGAGGNAASPYAVVTDVAKQWKGPKAKYIVLLSNGVDPYTSGGANQDSPYVASAIADAQRAGIQVSSIFYSSYNTADGQAYLHRLVEGTGGIEYFEGPANPNTLAPYFQKVAHDVSTALVGTFNMDANAGGKEHLVRFKLGSGGFRAPQAISPENQESPAK